MMLGFIQTFLKNKHTSGAAIAYGIAYGITQIGPVWFPQFADKFAKTGDLLQKLAVIYGLVAAGDASQSAKQVQEAKADVKSAIDTHDISILSKPIDKPVNPT